MYNTQRIRLEARFGQEVMLVLPFARLKSCVDEQQISLLEVF
jgi:hypothetical protein